MSSKKALIVIGLGLLGAGVVYVFYRRKKAASLAAPSTTSGTTTTTTGSTATTSTTISNPVATTPATNTPITVTPTAMDDTLESPIGGGAAAIKATAPNALLAAGYQGYPDLTGLFYEYMRRNYINLFENVYQFNPATWASPTPQDYSKVNSVGRTNCTMFLSQWLVGNTDATDKGSIVQAVASIYNTSPSQWTVDPSLKASLQQAGYGPLFMMP